MPGIASRHPASRVACGTAFAQRRSIDLARPGAWQRADDAHLAGDLVRCEALADEGLQRFRGHPRAGPEDPPRAAAGEAVRLGRDHRALDDVRMGGEAAFDLRRGHPDPPDLEETIRPSPVVE